MKKLFLAFFICFCQMAMADLPKEMTFGFIPGGDRENLKKGSVMIAKELQEEIGIPINVYIPKDYSALIMAMKNKKVDFAFLTAASFVAAEQEAKVQVLLKKVWVEPFYYSAILAKKNSSIQKLEDLKGKRLAFVDQKSTSGYLYPQVMFKKKGWNDRVFSKIVYSGSHAESVTLLEKGEVDAIVVFSDDKDAKKSAWTKFSKNDKKAEQIRVIWLSEPIPNDPFCVRSDFYEQYPKLVHNLMFSLIDVYEKLKGRKEVVDVIGAQGFLPATSRQYDPVREMVKELALKVE
jgi:phosphonate transport system substrate-binding protein